MRPPPALGIAPHAAGRLVPCHLPACWHHQQPGHLRQTGTGLPGAIQGIQYPAPKLTHSQDGRRRAPGGVLHLLVDGRLRHCPASSLGNHHAVSPALLAVHPDGQPPSFGSSPAWTWPPPPLWTLPATGNKSLLAP